MMRFPKSSREEMNLKEAFSLKTVNKLLLWSVILMFLGLLVGYGIKGFYSRYAADDYCYGYRVNQNGFFYNQIHSYTTLTEYSSNRFSLTLFNNVVEKIGGPQAIPFIPAAVIITWFLGLAYLFIQISEIRFAKEQTVIAIASAAVILFFTFYLAPNLYQILFWLSATNPYLTPLILLTTIAGRLLAVTKNNKTRWFNYVEFGLLSFLACGFSETAAVWQLALLSFGLFIAFIFKNRSAIAKNSIKPLSIIFLFALISLVIIVINPTNSIRGSPFSNPNLITLISKSIFHGEEFIRLSVFGKPLPFFAVFSFGFLFSSLANSFKPNMKVLLLFLLLINLISLSLIIATMIPSMYAMSAYPGDRALLPAHFTLVLTIFINGWIANNLITKLVPNTIRLRMASIYPMIGLVLLGYVTARIAPRVYDDLDKYQLRAQAWDVRHQNIINEKKAGNQDIIVPAFDSAYSIFEIQDKSFHWINMCVANYYGVKTIVARQYYQDTPTYPIGK